VLKLFHCVFAHSGGVSVFGQKDFQQLLILQRMMTQLAMPVDIIACATTRAPDGLALSSRNGYLSAEERTEAVQLSKSLNQLAQAVRADAGTGQLEVAALEAAAMDGLRDRGWQPDYICLRRQSDLSPVTVLSAEPLVVLGAARLGKTRLIDNLEV
jgi:pantoate--beta-alanine ligase